MLSTSAIAFPNSNESNVLSAGPVTSAKETHETSTGRKAKSPKDVEKERLETRRMLNRLTWKRKSLRAKQKMIDLTSARRDLSINNRKLVNENAKLKKLIRITRDPNQRRWLLQLIMQNPQMSNPTHHLLAHQVQPMQTSLLIGQLAMQQQHPNALPTLSENQISARLIGEPNRANTKQLNDLMANNLHAQQLQNQSSNAMLGSGNLAIQNLFNQERLRQSLALASTNPFGRVLNQQHLGVSNLALTLQQNALLMQPNAAMPYTGMTAYHTTPYAPTQELAALKLSESREPSTGMRSHFAR